MPHLLFITTANLATNPRLVKEIDLALQHKIGVSVLCFGFNNWSKNLNEQIKRRLESQISFYEISGNRSPLLPWFLSSLWYVYAKYASLVLPRDSFLLSILSNKRSYLLLNGLSRVKDRIDLVIGHNPGSFYPAEVFAKIKKIPIGIDLEDFHPGETNNKSQSKNFEVLLQQLLPKATYISAASPLIWEYTKVLLPEVPIATEVVRNYFSRSDFIEPSVNTNPKLLLVWFSQNISYNRGLEKVIPLVKNNHDLELHLFGNCNELFRQEFLLGSENIVVHPALSQARLHRSLSSYDVGLAIEPGKDLNNELALSNKMLAYFQAGVYILASETKAQTQFMNQYPDHGSLSPLNADELRKTFQELVGKKEEIRSSAKQRFYYAKEHCWETESQRLAQLWRKSLFLS